MLSRSEGTDLLTPYMFVAGKIGCTCSAVPRARRCRFRMINRIACNFGGNARCSPEWASAPARATICGSSLPKPTCSRNTALVFGQMDEPSALYACCAVCADDGGGFQTSRVKTYCCSSTTLPVHPGWAGSVDASRLGCRRPWDTNHAGRRDGRGCRSASLTWGRSITPMSTPADDH